MSEQEPTIQRGPISAAIHKLGEIAGVARPDWFTEEVWQDCDPGQRQMIRKFHDKGGAGFRILRSAETGLRTYKRRETDAE